VTRWTEERRARQAEAIRTWKPWEKATGPRTEEGKRTVARNPFKGGLRDEMRAVSKLLREIRKGQF
jgi:hypothetical protein